MAKTPVKKGAAKAAKSAAAGEKKKARKASRSESYATYIYRVLKQVHPEIGVSKKSMGILNSFVSDIFERIASKCYYFMFTLKE
jgi:histone H2B